ncbi:MAG TPA: ECF-type sigma factor [Steroidobacteraceae bacterium]|nr:ECF-type sigma factor [Steroidobacteraceae bacterium]
MGEITALLVEARHGDSASRQRFFSRVYSELNRLARNHLSRQSQITMLDAPGLVNEVYLRLAQQEDLPGSDRTAFLAYSSRVMRSVVIDYVRARAAERRGGGQRMLTLNTGVADQSFAEPQLEALGDALESLERVDERAHRVVEMRYFGGLEIEEIAAFLDVSAATVKRDWTKARAYLLHSMRQGTGAIR